MKKRIFKLISLVLIAALVINTNGFGLFEKKTAYAVGDLNVIWGVPDGDPIFEISNFLPGDMKDEDVDVSNGGTVPREVGVRGEKTEEIASFAGVLDFVISEGGSDLYGGTSVGGPKTLQEFFDESAGPNGIPLSTLNNGDTTTYNFKVTFPDGSGNEFQSAKVVFDLIIGIVSEIPLECENINFPNPPIFGTSGNDNISGTTGNDLIITFEGMDKISSGLGNDCVVTTGGGNDKVTTGVGNDVILTADGNDDINSGIGNDIIDAGNGNNKVNAGVGDDQVTTGSGNDDINLGVGNDTASSGGGNDKVVGGTGNDIVDGEGGDDDLSGGVGNDDLTGGLGVDKANGGTGTDTCDAETEISCEL
ncbi:MAG: hypothetical protein HY426_02110 [Candidatus Levybacteria bacterium]|nr:hypothetical protein [Candidatus Levybacteria bacterium]